MTDAASSLVELAQRVGGAGFILADPAFRFKTFSPKGQGRSPSKHYRDMAFDEIAALPVRKLAGDDCFLGIWIPFPHLPQGLKLFNAWGFKYSGSGFVWAKQNPSGVGFHVGLGFTTRKNAEVCYLGRRGKPKRLSKGVRELIIAPRREHSRKPDEVYEGIEALYAGPYVELFARQQRPGWFAWGDQVDRFSAPYDPLVDIQESVALGFATIRARVKNGEPGWQPK